MTSVINTKEGMTEDINRYRRTRQGPIQRKNAIEFAQEERMAFRLMVEASQGYGMMGMKEWLQQRFTSLENFLSSETPASKGREAVAGVITPTTVPKFVIPSRLSHRSKSENILDHKESETTLKFDDSMDGNVNFNIGYPEWGSLPNSNQSSPSDRVNFLRSESPAYSLSPLSESPNTRRKESLLLGSISTEDLISLHKLRAGRNTEYRQRKHQPLLHDSSCSLSVAADAALSSSVLSLVSGPDKLSFLSDNSYKLNSNRLYNRRRSSAPLKDCQMDSHSSLHFSQNSFPHSKEDMKTIAPQGELKLSVTYDRQTESLQVLLIRAENVGNHIQKSSHLNVYVKMCLLPEKSVQLSSKVVKGTHDPIFQEECTFNNITVIDLDRKILRLRICNKGSARRTDNLGEIIIPLHTLSLQLGEEVRMWRDVALKSSTPELGEIQVTSKFQPKIDRITVDVVQARALPKNLISGSPDTYVRLTLQQPNKPVERQKTRVRKGTSYPTYNHSFRFSVSTKLEDLSFSYLELSVMSRETLVKDRLIGQVRLGFASGSQAGLAHWRNMVGNPDREFTHWHMLMEKE